MGCLCDFGKQPEQGNAKTRGEKQRARAVYSRGDRDRARGITATTVPRPQFPSFPRLNSIPYLGDFHTSCPAGISQRHQFLKQTRRAETLTQEHQTLAAAKLSLRSPRSIPNRNIGVILDYQVPLPSSPPPSPPFFLPPMNNYHWFLASGWRIWRTESDSSH